MIQRLQLTTAWYCLEFRSNRLFNYFVEILLILDLKYIKIS